MVEPGVSAHLDALDLLAEASGILASSFDLAVTLPKISQLCIEKLADYCAIYVDQGDGPASTIQASREPELRAVVNDVSAIPDVLREHGFESVVISPLQRQTEVLGTFVLAAESRDAFNESMQKLATVLALQIANAIEQCLLFERTHRVADRLQRALLPDRLPPVKDAVFHAAYRPASDEAEVGGDWYDAFSLPDGRIGISMGDVAGHGLDAATVMGEVRQAMRTAAVNEGSPAVVLQQVNGVINLRKGIGMVTAILGYYDPKNRELTYAVAGHPPPILIIAGGFSGFLPGGGMPLGVEQTVNARDWIVTLPPMSCVVFYTDGMTEYSRDILAGEERLLENSVRSFMSDSENPAIALQERVFDATVNRDDAATLTLSCDDGPVPQTMRFSAIPLTAPIVRSVLHRFCDEHDLTRTQRFSLITAAGEAIANAVEHAYRGQTPGELVLRTEVDAESVTLEIEDHGRWRPFQRREERGRGIVLMHELMHRVRITSAQNRTVIKLTLRREEDAIS
jgi:anti-sigma regulatory factor (Ser/Thr protein kinase)